MAFLRKARGLGFAKRTKEKNTKLFYAIML